MAVGFLTHYVCISGWCGMRGEGACRAFVARALSSASQTNSKAGTATGMLGPGRMLGLSVGQAWSRQPTAGITQKPQMWPIPTPESE